MAKTATLKSATASVRKAKARKPAKLSQRQREVAEREEDERRRFWIDLGEKGRRRLPALMTMEDLIVALGGPRAIGDWLYNGEPERWLEQGYVTRGYDLQVYLTLTTMGYRHIDPKLFGVPNWSYLVPPTMRLPELPAA
jgi:hypothetical protein